MHLHPTTIGPDVLHDAVQHGLVCRRSTIRYLAPTLRLVADNERDKSRRHELTALWRAVAALSEEATR